MTRLRRADKRARQWDKNWMIKLYKGGGRASARYERRGSSKAGRRSMIVVSCCVEVA